MNIAQSSMIVAQSSISKAHSSIVNSHPDIVNAQSSTVSLFGSHIMGTLIERAVIYLILSFCFVFNFITIPLTVTSKSTI